MACGESGCTEGPNLYDDSSNGGGGGDDDDNGSDDSSNNNNYYYLLPFSNLVSVRKLRPVTSKAHCVNMLAIHLERQCLLQSMRCCGKSYFVNGAYYILCEHSDRSN